MPAVDRYKGYIVYSLREPYYKVLEGKEVFEVREEKTGKSVFQYVAYYNPKALLAIEDKEGLLQTMMKRALNEIRKKIDAQDLSSSLFHVGLRA